LNYFTLPRTRTSVVASPEERLGERFEELRLDRIETPRTLEMGLKGERVGRAPMVAQKRKGVTENLACRGKGTLHEQVDRRRENISCLKI